MDIEAGARKHGVTDDEMLHALRNHWRALETDDPAVTVYIGRSRRLSRSRSAWSTTMKVSQ